MHRLNVLARSSVALPLLALAACGGPPALYGDKSSPATSTEKPQPPPPDMAMDVYPSGPYGNQPGEVMGDIDLQGYRLTLDQTDSTMLAWEDHLTLASVRSDARNAKCIWLQTDALW